MTYIFDSSATLRYMDRQAGASRVKELLKDHALGMARILISAIQWGEIARIIGKRHGVQAVPGTLSRLDALGFEVSPVFAEQAVRAAMLQNALKLPYADAFLIVLAQDHQSSVLVTADFDLKPADRLITIEFLPPNP